MFGKLVRDLRKRNVRRNDGLQYLWSSRGRALLGDKSGATATKADQGTIREFVQFERTNAEARRLMAECA